MKHEREIDTGSNQGSPVRCGGVRACPHCGGTVWSYLETESYQCENCEGLWYWDETQPEYFQEWTKKRRRELADWLTGKTYRRGRALALLWVCNMQLCGRGGGGTGFNTLDLSGFGIHSWRAFFATHLDQIRAWRSNGGGGNQ